MRPVVLARWQLDQLRSTVRTLADGGPFRRATTAATLGVVFALPWSDAVPAGGALAKLLGFGGAGTAVIAVLVENGLRRRPSEAQVLGAAFLALALLSLTWSIDEVETESFVVPIVQIVALLLLAWEFCPGRDGARALARAFVLGCGVCAVVAIGASLLGGRIEDNRLQVGEAQPNDLAYTLSLAVPVAWYLSRLAVGRWARLAYLAVIPASLYSIVLVASRSGLVVGLLGLVIVPWTLVEGDRRRLTALLFVVLAAVPLVPQLLPADQVSRLSSTGSELTGGTLNGRSELWSAAWGTFAEHPIAGVGAGASRTELLERTGMDFRSHNTPLSIAAELGALGLMLAGLFTLVVVHQAARTTGLERKMVVVLGLILAIGLQVRHWEYQPLLWVAIVILVGMGDGPVPYAGPSASSRSRSRSLFAPRSR